VDLSHVSNSDLQNAPTETGKIVIAIVSHGRWFKRMVLVFGDPTRLQLSPDQGSALDNHYSLQDSRIKHYTCNKNKQITQS